MNVQQYKLNIRQTGDKFINIPIKIDFDVLGRDDAIDEYQNKVVNELIGEAEDFEVQRFTHAPYSPNNETKLYQDFYFRQTGGAPQISYLSEGFTDKEIYYYANSFNNSFFKLDLFETPDSNSQTNYLTLILPVQQGDFDQITIMGKPVRIRKPSFKLDFIGDKEGFFIYWLKKKTFLNIDTFYVGARFFNGKTGNFSRFLNMNGQNPSLSKNFNQSDYFYYKYVLNYNDKTYQIFEHGLNKSARVGIPTNPMRWYEYIF